MKIHFVDELPKTGMIHYCHFNHQNLHLPNAQYADIKALAKIHEKSFFDEIEKWHSAINLLGLKESKSWWLTSCSRLMSWAPPFFTPLFFHYLLQIYLKEKQINEIYVLDAPKEVLELAPDFFNDISINMNQKNDLVETKSFFDNHMKPYLAYLKNYLFRRLKPNKLEKRPYLIHTSILNPENLLKGLDHYFGSAFFKLPENKRKQITWVFLYVQNDPVVKNKIKNYFSSLGFQVIFTYDSFNLFQVLGLFLQSIQIKLKINSLIKRIPPIKIKNVSSPIFTKIYARQCLEQKQDSLIELEVYQSLKKHLSEISPKKIIFAFEERSVEHAILMANNEQKDQATCFGFVHSVMHQGHICFDHKHPSEANPPRPHKILVTGIAASDWFREKGYSQNQIAIIGSPRCVLNFTAMTENKNRLKILFILGQPHELLEFAMSLKENPNILRDYDLTIRQYPYGWFEEQKKGLELLKTFYPNPKDGGGNLHDQLKAHDIVFFSSSSAGIEAILNGKLSIHIQLDQYYNLNPLEYAKNAKSLITCHNLDELEKTLIKIKNLNPAEWNNLVQNQMTDAQLIYQAFNVDLFLNEQ